MDFLFLLMHHSIIIGILVLTDGLTVVSLATLSSLVIEGIGIAYCPCLATVASVGYSLSLTAQTRIILAVTFAFRSEDQLYIGCVLDSVSHDLLYLSIIHVMESSSKEAIRELG